MSAGLGLGVVTTFDEQAGYGTVRDDEGLEHFFHCTAIVNGSRSIVPGTRVAFNLTPGHQGNYEAGSITVVF